MRCDECRFWGSAEESPELVPMVRICKRPKMLWDATEWFRDNPPALSDRRLTAEAKDDLMFVQDGSDYHAELLTCAAFFCAHFTARDGAAENPE